MSLLEKASLIVTPNAYKESILYSVVPNTTLGDMTVVRATTATRVNSEGLIESVGVNVSRIDYTNGSCPSLLVEPQRTNLVTYSNDFSNASWGKIGITVVLNSQLNPEGINSTYNISNTTLGDSYLEKQGLQTTAGNYTMSVFIKNIDNLTTSQLMAVHLVEGSATSQLTYTWATNTFTLVGTNAISGSSVLYNNGWVRLTFTYSIGSSVSNHWARLYANQNLSITKSALVYGFQLEQGSYATSYIPTVATSVTRNADAISKTGISSLIGQTEGTLFVDLKSAYNGWITLSDNSDANGVLLSFSKEYSSLNYFIYANSVDIIGTGFVAFTSEPMKLAFKYKSGEIKFFVNGVLVYTNTSTFAFSNNLNFFGNRLYWGGGLFEGSINSEQLYKTALTDAECIDLTTL